MLAMLIVRVSPLPNVELRVLARSNQREVVRTNARGVLAKMMYGVTLKDLPHPEFVCKPMRENALRRRNAELPIALVSMPLVLPASLATLHAGVETLLRSPSVIGATLQQPRPHEADQCESSLPV